MPATVDAGSSTLEQRKNGARISTIANKVNPSVAHESDHEQEDEDDDSTGKSRSGRGPTLSASINFVQLLVFATLMLQALTLFVTYHMLQTTQHHMLKDIPTIHSNLAELQRDITFIQTQLQLDDKTTIISLKPNPIQPQPTHVVEPTTPTAEAKESEPVLVEEEEAEVSQEEDDDEEEGVEVIVIPDWEDEHGTINVTALDEAIVAIQSGHRTPVSPKSTKNNAPGGNRFMELSAHDAAILHLYRNWTDRNGVAVDAGTKHNQTTAVLQLLGQYDARGNAIKDVRVLEPVRDERTMVAARDIKQGEYFYKIHQDHLLTSLIVEQSEIGMELVASDLEELDELVELAVYILFEKLRPESKWKAWLNILPLSFRHMPVMFDWYGELEYIEGTLALHETQGYQTLYRKEYVQLSHHLTEADFTQFTFAQYVWARCAVTSRAFGVDVYGPKRLTPQQRSERDAAIADGTISADLEEVELVSISCLTAADLINHQSEIRKVDGVWGWNENTHEFAFKAIRDIPTGTVIHTTYGPRGNTDLFTHYGFTLPNNPYNTAGACLAASTADFGFSLKQTLLSAVFNAGDRAEDWNICRDKLPNGSAIGYHCRFQLDLTMPSSQECFTYARIATSNVDEFNQVFQTAHQLDVSIKQLNEAKGIKQENPALHIFKIGAIGYESELRAIESIGAHALLSLNRIIGGPSSNDSTILSADERAHKNGFCTNDASRWYPLGPCLTHNQLNLFHVRMGEKQVLENLIQLAELTRTFSSSPPDTVEASYHFLDQLKYSPEKLSAWQTVDATPPYDLLRYLNENFLPLYFHYRNWTSESDSPHELYHEFQRLYHPEDDTRDYEFSF